MVLKKKSKIMVITFSVFIGLLILFNLAMFVMAKLESNRAESADRWLIEPQELAPAGEPVNRSVILVHGFADSPANYKELALELSERGFHVIVPVLPGQNMASWAYDRGDYSAEFLADWLKDLIEKETSRYKRKPYLLGFSMGGTLSIICASENKIEKLALIAPYFRLSKKHGFSTIMAKHFRFLIPLTPKLKNGNINSPKEYNKYRPGSFINSMAAFNILQNLAEMAKKKIDKLDCPVLLCGSPNDETAQFETALNLFKNRSNVIIKKYPESNHILLHDYDKEKVKKEILEFLRIE